MVWTHQNDNSKPTSRQQQVDPTLDLGDLDIEPRGYDTCFVQPPIELDDNLAGTVIIYYFEFANVAWQDKCRLSVGWGKWESKGSKGKVARCSLHSELKSVG